MNELFIKNKAKIVILATIFLLSSLFIGGTGAKPGGDKIAFHSGRDGNAEVYVMNADGTVPINLTNNPADDMDPSYPSDGSKIAFESDRDGNLEIYSMNADGTGQTNLTGNSGGDYEPSFSPDGSKIAFVSIRGGDTDYEIYIMNADGTGQTKLTDNSAGDNYPCFSPDGSKIAFHSGRDGNNEIYIMNADGTGQTNLTGNLGGDLAPSFSPDGSKIAFVSQRDGNAEIYVMDADGTSQTRLTNNSTDDWYPCFSPDGSKIAFRSSRDGNNEIYVMDADGASQTNMTNNPADDSSQDWGNITGRGILITAQVAEELTFSITQGTAPVGGSVTSSAIDFGELTIDTPKTGTQNLAVTTNAPSGYSVTTEENRPLTMATNTIPDVLGDDTPTTDITEVVAGNWSLNTTHGFGYSLANITGSDAVFTTGYKQFADKSKLTPEVAQIVMSNASPVTGSEVEVEYKVNISSSQTAGSYTNNVSYLATGNF